jgi:hypothetical protein
MIRLQSELMQSWRDRVVGLHAVNITDLEHMKFYQHREVRLTSFQSSELGSKICSRVSILILRGISRREGEGWKMPQGTRGGGGRGWI